MSYPPTPFTSSIGNLGKGLGFYEPRIYAVIYCSHILAPWKATRKHGKNEGANNDEAAFEFGGGPWMI